MLKEAIVIQLDVSIVNKGIFTAYIIAVIFVQLLESCSVQCSTQVIEVQKTLLSSENCVKVTYSHIRMTSRL